MMAIIDRFRFLLKKRIKQPFVEKPADKPHIHRERKPGILESNPVPRIFSKKHCTSIEISLVFL